MNEIISALKIFINDKTWRTKHTVLPRAAISKLVDFWVQSSRSYIVLALIATYYDMIRQTRDYKYK